VHCPRRRSDLRWVCVGLGFAQLGPAVHSSLGKPTPTVSTCASKGTSLCTYHSTYQLTTGAQKIYTMASAPRKAPASSQAEVALLPSLKNCLLNLPTSLVNVLLNSNAVVQNVVVELSFKSAAGSDGKPGKQQSVFLGWTGMRSQTRRSGPRQEQEVAGVEVDATFGRLLGLRDGMKVRCLNY
jgi:hypothetical protein